jgi:site-specific DNA-cytosine methylase
MKVLELFAGTRSIGKAFGARGHEIYSVEWDKDFENIDLYADVLTVTAKDILEKFGHPDVIWASPDCTTFSIAAISHHRRKNAETGNLDAVSEYAKFCDKVDQHVLELIRELHPRYWFIENPRGGIWYRNLMTTVRSGGKTVFGTSLRTTTN